MFRKCLILCLLVLLASVSCGKKQDWWEDMGIYVDKANKPVPVKAEKSLGVSLHKSEIQTGSLPDEAMRRKAESAGVKSLFKHYLSNEFMLTLSNVPPDKPLEPRFEIYGPLLPEYEPAEGTYSQDYKFMGELLPYFNLAGVIKGFHNYKYMGSTFDLAFVKFFDDKSSPGKPSYFLIGRKSTSGDKRIRIVGSAFLRENMPGGEAQIELMENTNEVMAGDVVFRVDVKGEALKVPIPAPVIETDRPARGSDVVIEPKMETQTSPPPVARKTAPKKPKKPAAPKPACPPCP